MQRVFGNLTYRLLLATIATLLLVAFATTALAYPGEPDSAVRVGGVVIAPGWTPPGVSQVTICTPDCQTTMTGNLGGFSVEGVKADRQARITVVSGIGRCEFERWVGRPSWFASAVNVGPLICWR